MNVFWVRRDARVQDNEALAAATADPTAALLALFIYDPNELCAGDVHESHLVFINAGLVDLNEALLTHTSRTATDVGLTYRVGPALSVFRALHASQRIAAIFSHTELGTADHIDPRAAVRAWASSIGIRWHEFDQDGVQAKRPTHGWAAAWAEAMGKPLAKLPRTITFVPSATISRGSIVHPPALPDLKHRGLRPHAQKGGERLAQATLSDFLHRRAATYSYGLSSPVTAWDACSRLSAYLAWGHISLRAVHHGLLARQIVVRRLAAEPGREKSPWGRSLAAFAARLRWRSHFSQKLHDAPHMTVRNLCSAFDGLRPGAPADAARLAAWLEGRTGYPLVDACMRALHATGWINFRMRAMVVSFACYTLWLDWRLLAAPLARLFLDYVPGIHFPQLQMQAGTTGTNANRVYNVVKQLRDHDPRGTFVRKFVPELIGVPDSFLAEPWTMPRETQRNAGCVIGQDYPRPIVEMNAANREARSRFVAIRGKSATKEEARRVLLDHGSRKRPRSQTQVGERTVTTDLKKARKCSVCREEGHVKGPRCKQWMRSADRQRQTTLDGFVKSS